VAQLDFKAELSVEGDCGVQVFDEVAHGGRDASHQGGALDAAEQIGGDDARGSTGATGSRRTTRGSAVIAVLLPVEAT
jgi:hypothetical protein